MFPPVLGNGNDTPAFPTASEFQVPGAAAATQFETFRVYVPWVSWRARNSLPVDYLISGLTPDGTPQISPLDLSKYLTTPGGESGSASLAGPFTAESRGFVPVVQDLPFTVHFQNDEAAPTRTSEVRVVVNLDDKLDPRTFRLGDIRLGDIVIDVPDDRANFQQEIDYTRTRGFILRVSGGIDLASHTATWLLQAIDPSTGELIQDPTKGLLKPNNSHGEGAGYVSYTVQVADDTATGESVRTTARVILNNAPPEDTAPLRFLVDGGRPRHRR